MNVTQMQLATTLKAPTTAHAVVDMSEAGNIAKSKVGHI